MGWSQDVEVDPVVGDDVVKLFALGHQLHPAREPGPRHLLVCRVPEGKGSLFLSLEFEISFLPTSNMDTSVLTTWLFCPTRRVVEMLATSASLCDLKCLSR